MGVSPGTTWPGLVVGPDVGASVGAGELVPAVVVEPLPGQNCHVKKASKTTIVAAKPRRLAIC